MSAMKPITPAEVVTEYLSNGVRDLPSQQRAQEMLDIDMQYGACFMNRDFDGMEKCLVDSPDFEMQPLGIRIQGMKAYKERSRRLQAAVPAQLDPRTGAQRQFRAIAFGKDCMVIEWASDHVLPDGVKKRCYFVAVIDYDGDKIVGERVYTCANAGVLRQNALGPDFASMEGVSKI